jgi:hypothetical protein
VNSASLRSFTVVTVMTLILMPVFRGHHWLNVLIGKKVETQIVQCQPGDPCPARKHITQTTIQR